MRFWYLVVAQVRSLVFRVNPTFAHVKKSRVWRTTWPRRPVTVSVS